MTGTLRISLDETSVRPERWTEKDGDLRDSLLARRSELLPGELAELTRCRKFNPGDVVRSSTVEGLHNIRRVIRVRIQDREKDKADAARANAMERCRTCECGRKCQYGNKVCASCKTKRFRERKAKTCG